ncbi:MAG: NAD(P)H-hydrate dehydratase [Myxococcales bacterium]|nr:NAD(P)H-hydrate dehydratase [Myxococcales bacterium]
MRRSVWPLVDAAQMRARDHHTIENLRVPGDLLMESAGRAVADAVLEQLGPGDAVVVVCGAGNNGGDGLVAARHLHLEGVPVRVALLAEPSRLRGDAASNLRRARALGVPIDGARWRAPQRGVLVDAIFGTGLSRPVTGPAAAGIRRINAARASHPHGLRVIAVDLPSGLCADTGQVLGTAVEADVTLTLALPKLGLTQEPGRSLAGRIRVARIGVADTCPQAEVTAELWTRAGVAARLPARPRGGHKGTFGHVLLVAGSEGKTGAAALAAEGAARIGAGLVTIACPAGLNDILEIKCTEAMTAPLPDTPSRGLAAGAEEGVLALAATRDAVGLGPGLGRDAETLALVRAVAKRLETPLALDADAVFAFRDDPALLTARRAATVLTPHPGEAAELLGCSAGEVNRDRPAAARRLAERSGTIVLLKGAGTIAATPEGRIVVNPTGGPNLATGGTGDVLLGLVAGLLAQGCDAWEAAGLAAYVHGAAADALARTTGSAGILATDLARAVPGVLAALRAESAAVHEGGLAVSFPEP